MLARFLVFLFLFFLITRRRPKSTRLATLFPYTTLFRSLSEFPFRSLARGPGNSVRCTQSCSVGKSAAPIAPIPALVATKRLASPASSEVWQFRCPRKNPRRSPNQIRKRPAVFHPQVVRRAFRGPSRRI